MRLAPAVATVAEPKAIAAATASTAAMQALNVNQY